MTERDDGFTLVELLVVIIIIAILAAVAVPVFLAQREKGYAAQVQAALKNASTAVEAYATQTQGDYSGLDSPPDLTALMLANGYVVPSWASTFDVTASATGYCIEIRHASLERDSPWRRATYLGKNGAPTTSPDACPAAPSL